MRVASIGSQPHAWVASTTTRAWCAAAASSTASRSTSSPVDDCTTLTATTSVRSSTAPATSATATHSTSMSRPCARNGHRSEVNSGSAEMTRAPSGREAAISPIMLDVFAPMATQSVGTPTSRPNDARALSVASPQTSQLVRPPRQSPSTA
jgi:hypothetical protein